MSCENQSAAMDSGNDLSNAAWSDDVDRREPPTQRSSALQWVERLSSTRANSWLGLAADTGVGVALLYAGLALGEVSLLSALCVVVAGAFAFSFVEYCFHRWLFHGSAALFEQGHHRHHEVPLGHESLPFFFAPLAILGLAGLIGLVAPKEFALLFTGGFAAGYAAYGLSHTVIHHIRFENALIRRWAAAHHIHHYHPDSNFGVTTPLWDILLRTRYARHER
jgi:sterol desaturase/sphingolipid hydroxylase (fatty acid hydroxylase superfamily)